MKHQEHILAFTSAFVTDVLKLDDGVTVDENFDEGGDLLFSQAALPYIEIKQRYALDISYEGKISTHRQLLPYMVFTKCDKDGKDLVLAYQRAKGIGEARLLGKKSIGVGGHVDLADVAVDEEGVLCLQTTVHTSIVREFDEELKIEITAGDGTPLAIPNPKAEFSQLLSNNVVLSGFINDTSDMVGRDHLGVFGVIQLPSDVDVSLREDSLVQLGWFTLDELLSDGQSFENWSKLLIETLAGV